MACANKGSLTSLCESLVFQTPVLSLPAHLTLPQIWCLWQLITQDGLFSISQKMKILNYLVTYNLKSKKPQFEIFSLKICMKLLNYVVLNFCSEDKLISKHMFSSICYYSEWVWFLRTLDTSPVELGMVCKTPDILSLEELTV